MSLGNSHTFTAGGQSITVTAWELDIVGAYTAALLWQRNVSPNDQGLGVCDSKEGIANCSGTGNGIYNEISNHFGAQDVVRIDFGSSGFSAQSALLASLDTGSSKIDHYQIFGSNLGNPTLVPSGNVTLLASGDAGVNPNPTIVLSGNFQFLYFTTSSTVAIV